MQSPLKGGEDPDTALGDHPTRSRDAGLSRLQRHPGRGTLEELGSGRVSATSALTAGLWGQRFISCCCRHQYSRTQAAHWESWSTQAHCAGGPGGVNTPSSEPAQRGYRVSVTRTA
ncbi:unnamed protein product [Rangifer tarandus platyrhynchus]|uniref:Uncharacterized protein n=1 Tax=Rangifer tarandus platyrhynchus TaxID=3082113 RepID=A0AC59YSU4_RANTA